MRILTLVCPECLLLLVYLEGVLCICQCVFVHSVHIISCRVCVFYLFHTYDLYFLSFCLLFSYEIILGRFDFCNNIFGIDQFPQYWKEIMLSLLKEKERTRRRKSNLRRGNLYHRLNCLELRSNGQKKILTYIISIIVQTRLKMIKENI